MSSSNTSDYVILFRCSLIDSPSSKVLVCKETGTNNWKINRKGRDHRDGDMSYREFMHSHSDVKAAVSLLCLHSWWASQQLYNLVTDPKILSPAES